mgnify:CR=1 FL=1
MLFELDVDALKPFRSRTNRFTHLPEYPMTDYDISLLFDSQVKWSQMYDVIAQGIRRAACSMERILWTSTTASSARREEVRHHPADHRLPGKDPDLHGDRGVRLRRHQEAHQAPGGRSCAPGKIRFSLFTAPEK